MKILYFGTVCNMDAYDEMLEGCSSKPSVAAIVFESALLDGLRKNGAELEIHSFPMVPTFPGSRLLRFGGGTERLAAGYECHWLNTINLPVLKQLSRKWGGRRVLKRWTRENASEGVVLTYSIPPFLVKEVIKYSKKNGVKTIALVPDLLRDMYMNERQSSLLTKAKQLYLKPALRLQGEYDGYVYLTEAMHEVVAPGKPYIVMEGIAGIADGEADPREKAFPRAVMYAGMLHEKYGIVALLDAFEMINTPDTELWLFGEGTAVEAINKRAAGNPAIKYFGTVPRNEIMMFEKKATLLVNARNPDDEFTLYSFPSKMIEYMLSGTPLLTTKLKGIPEEYLEYVFLAEDGSAESLALALSEALGRSDAELVGFGRSAREFVKERADAKRQASRIMDFINGVSE